MSPASFDSIRCPILQKSVPLIENVETLTSLRNIRKKAPTFDFLLNNEEETTLLSLMRMTMYGSLSFEHQTSVDHVSKKIKKFTKWEMKHDVLLQIAVSKLGINNWEKIAVDYFIKRRDAEQCRIRYFKLLNESKVQLIQKTQTSIYIPSCRTLSARSIVGQQMKLIKKSYQENSQSELKRLREKDILISSVEKQLDQMMSEIAPLKDDVTPDEESDSEFIPTDPDQVKVLFGRALEVKNLCSVTHYVFIHAQDSSFAISSYLIKALSKYFAPERDVRLFKFLRIAQQNSPFTIQDLMLLLLEGYTDRATFIRKELLSADAFFFNCEEGESAMHFLYQKCSMLSLEKGTKGFRDVYEYIIKAFLPQASALDISQLVKEFLEMNKVLVSEASGNLFVICVPKEMVDDPRTNCLFRSHSMGMLCNCHPQEENSVILNKLQQNILDESTMCKDFNHASHSKARVPQYRLKISALTPEQGVMSFLFTPFTAKLKKELKHKINLLGLKIYALHLGSKKSER